MPNEKYLNVFVKGKISKTFSTPPSRLLPQRGGRTLLNNSNALSGCPETGIIFIAMNE
jgi:hypothetical protein